MKLASSYYPFSNPYQSFKWHYGVRTIISSSVNKSQNLNQKDKMLFFHYVETDKSSYQTSATHQLITQKNLLVIDDLGK